VGGGGGGGYQIQTSFRCRNESSGDQEKSRYGYITGPMNYRVRTFENKNGCDRKGVSCQQQPERGKYE
jgi:hypothetical protein